MERKTVRCILLTMSSSPHPFCFLSTTDVRSHQAPVQLSVLQNRHRDQGCRFPGCERTRWTHSHHRIHWAQGGPTDLDNLITLCPHHHRLAHEGGWTIEGNPDEELRFVRPDGRAFGHDPAPLATDWWDQFLADFYTFEPGPDPPDTS